MQLHCGSRGETSATAGFLHPVWNPARYLANSHRETTEDGKRKEDREALSRNFLKLSAIFFVIGTYHIATHGTNGKSGRPGTFCPLSYLCFALWCPPSNQHENTTWHLPPSTKYHDSAAFADRAPLNDEAAFFGTRRLADTTGAVRPDGVR